MKPVKINNLPEPINAYQNLGTVKSVSDALKSQSMSLVSVKKELGEERILSYLIKWIIATNDFINVKNKQTPDQIKLTARYILQDYYYFKISDIYLIFTNAQKGRYGQFYDSIDGSKILSWFESYAKERSEIAESISFLEHDKIKAIEKREESFENVIKDVTKIGKQI